jgi:hypothetical protein
MCKKARWYLKPIVGFVIPQNPRNEKWGRASGCCRARQSGGCRDNLFRDVEVLGGVWNYEDLNTYLYGPTLTTPGVLMEIRGIPDKTERVNLIAYLRTLSDNPAPLP